MAAAAAAVVDDDSPNPTMSNESSSKTIKNTFTDLSTPRQEMHTQARSASMMTGNCLRSEIILEKNNFKKMADAAQDLENPNGLLFFN